MTDVFINSLGSFLPGPPIPNNEMEEYLGLINGKPSRSRALILRQNKIETRHYALNRQGIPQHSSADMAAHAVQDAIKKSEILANDITYLASSATLGDTLVPGLASHVHAALKLPPLEIASFQSVCGSAFMALKSAYLQVKAGEHACAAVTGSEFSSRYFRPGFYEGTTKINAEGRLDFDADFLRFTLSDGGGAAILENKPNTRNVSLKILWIDIRSYAERFDTCMLAGAARTDEGLRFWSHFETPGEAYKNGAIMLTQDFDLLKRIIPVWVTHYMDMIDQGKIQDFDHLCSHYSSHSLREETVRLLKAAGVVIPEEKWFTNLYTKGNTGTASIFIMLEELFNSGKLAKGEKILCHVPESGRALNGFMLLEVV